jgi:predicted nucleotidyltransferase component of viral defense system
VHPKLLVVLDKLMQTEILNNFYLVGGTALALWIGHRKSVDLDFFIHQDFDSQSVAFALEKELSAKSIETGKNLVRCFVSGVKVEFISHQYSLLKKPEIIDNLRLASIEDLAAFKLNAIVNRGSKKDFWDIAYLLNQFKLNQLLKFYSQKYSWNNLWQVEKSLCYFSDADNELVEIIDLGGLDWETVKSKIRVASKKTFL